MRKRFNSSSGKEEYSEPESWEFDYPDQMWWTGYWLWKLSKYTWLPSQDDIAKYDPRWISDMRLAMWLDNAQNSTSPIQHMFDQYMSNVGTRETSPEEYKAMKETGGYSEWEKKNAKK